MQQHDNSHEHNNEWNERIRAQKPPEDISVVVFLVQHTSVSTILLFVVVLLILLLFVCGKFDVEDDVVVSFMSMSPSNWTQLLSKFIVDDIMLAVVVVAVVGGVVVAVVVVVVADTGRPIPLNI